MTTDTKEPWIAVGYDLFAKDGPQGLKVEVIARAVQKSKSSFYHHFADVELFTEVLLSYHLKRTKIIAQREKLCNTINPDLIDLLLDVKQDLLFSRQLRVNRHTPAFRTCFEQSNKEITDVFLDVWAKDIGLTDKPSLARSLFKLSLENFYLQITEESLTQEWLLNYFSELRLMVTEFNRP